MEKAVDVNKLVSNKIKELQIILKQILMEFHNVHHISYPDLWKAFLQLESKLGTKLEVFEIPENYPKDLIGEIKHFILNQNITTIDDLTHIMELFQISYKEEIEHHQMKFVSPDEVLNTLIASENITIKNIPISELINLYLSYYDFVTVNFVYPIFNILTKEATSTESLSLEYKINAICDFLTANGLKKEIFFLCKYVNEMLRNAFLKNQYFIDNEGITFLEFNIDLQTYVSKNISLSEFSKIMLSIIFSKIIITNIISLRVSDIQLDEFVQYLDMLIKN